MTDNPNAVKFVDGSDDIIEGLILPYGGPNNGNDLTGTRFTKSTDFSLDWFPDGGRPGLYGHGFDSELGTEVIGREVKSWKSDAGIWMQGQLDKSHRYWAQIKALVDAGKLSLSSGGVDHLVNATKSGEIQRWPWVEWSLVPNPANPEAVVYSVRSTDAIAHLGIVDTNVPAEVTTDAEPVAVKVDEPNVEPLSILSAIKALNLTPQSIHDAAIASGATCPGETSDSPPAPLLAIAGKSVETAPPIDLDALRAEMRAAAIKQARELTTG